MAAGSGGAGCRCLGPAAGIGKGAYRRRLRLLQPASARLGRGPPRGQDDHPEHRDRHTRGRPVAGGARHRAGGPRGVGRRGQLRTGARAVHPGTRRRGRHGDRPVRQPGRDGGDGLPPRRALPAPGRLEVPCGRAGVRQRARRAGHRLRDQRGRLAAARPADFRCPAGRRRDIRSAGERPRTPAMRPPRPPPYG